MDRSVIQLLEDKKLKKSDFIVTENYHIQLEDYTAKMLIDKIKANCNYRRQCKGRNATYDTILQDNVQQLANHIMDKQEELTFQIPVITIQSRDDDLELREFILNLRPEERRKLGINRNTLWYMRENLKKGKKALW